MSRVSIQQVKSKFESGDRPTQADYLDLIDTLVQQATDLGSSGNNESEINGIENTTIIDRFVYSEWRMVKYLVSISKKTAGDNKFFATEMNILLDNEDINISEYGVIDNDGDIGTVSVSKVGTELQLVVTPNPAIKPITVRFARMGLKA